MSLDYHIDVLAPATLENGDSTVYRTKFNDNFTRAEEETQKVEDRVEDTFSTLVGEGLTSTPTTSYSGTSLGVTIGAFTSLIGVEVVYAGGIATCLASQTDASLYFCQDGTWSTTLPTTKSYFIFATYTTDATGITTFTLSNVKKLLSYQSITDTISGIVVPESPGYVDYYVDHSSIVSFLVDGFITLTVDSDDFYVELLYDTKITYASDTPNTPPHAITEQGFYVRITRQAGYYYADDNSCELTYIRTGMV